MQKKHNVLFFIALMVLFCNYIKAQNTLQNFYILHPEKSLYDTLPYPFLPTSEIKAINKGLTDREIAILRYRVYKTWDYALLSSLYLREIDLIQDSLSKRKYNKYIAKKEREIWSMFGDILKRFSQNDGKILVKLIHRQTGMTTYEIVKKYRSSTRSFFYNSTAWFFNISLKSKYQPQSIAEDFWIEYILQEAFLQGRLQNAEKTKSKN